MPMNAISMASGKVTIAVFERYSDSTLSHNTDFAVTVPSDYVVVGGGGEGRVACEGRGRLRRFAPGEADDPEGDRRRSDG